MPASAPKPKPSVPAALPELQPDFRLLHSRQHVALAVSGGSDSVALLRLVHRWAGSIEKPPRISVLTVDHGLRSGSDAEAAQVGLWSSVLSIEHHTLAWNGPKPTTGLQAKARQARYGLMAAWCRAHAAEVLVTAHTMDDQAETVLMRLARTTSPDSLSGIPVSGQWDGLPLLRPLLGFRREALRRYLTAIGQNWIEDPSNADRRFERVRIRDSLTELAASGLTAERLSGLAKSCARTSALLDTCADSWMQLWLREEDEGICYAPSQELSALPNALQQRIFGRLVAHYGGGLLKPERGELARLTQWLIEGPVRCTLSGAVLGRRKNEIWVTREAARIDRAPLTIGETGLAIWDGRFAISAPVGSTVGAAGENGVEKSAGVPIYARRAYPAITLPDGSAGQGEAVTVTFLRLQPS